MSPNLSLRHLIGLLAAMPVSSSLDRLAAQVPPGLLNYQGRLVVGGTNFDGPAFFKFALTKGTNGPILWSNDGTLNGSPVSAVSLPVAKGLYGVLLGDTGDPSLQGMTASISADVFTNAEVHLRVWFAATAAGPFDLLTPDQRVASVGYAMMAAQLAPGAIQSDQLPADPEFVGTATADRFTAPTAGFGDLTTTNLMISEGGHLALPATGGGNAGRLTLSGLSFLHAFGIDNTFLGSGAGVSLEAGATNNTGLGSKALSMNTKGSQNTATGNQALTTNSRGNRNTAIGDSALHSNLSGDDNTGIGRHTLHANLDGIQNTAIGSGALSDNLHGTNNIAVGFEAGTGVIEGNNNIHIGNKGEEVESNVVRIGTPGTHTSTFLAGALFAPGLAFPLTSAAEEGVLKIGAARFLHAFGGGNTFLGRQAGNFTMTGVNNTAVGNNALNRNSGGSHNTASGFIALSSNKAGTANTANGSEALTDNTDGSYNTAAGYSALGNNKLGSYNTAIGYHTLNSITGGSNNLALGSNAGNALTDGSGNIYIGHQGSPVESDTLRLGSSQTTAFVAGVFGSATPEGSAVYVNAAGQLGTVNSSGRFKEAVQDMDSASSVILKFRPVTFRYKPNIDPIRAPQFGLIAEEVSDVAPELVVHDAQGQIQSVRYDAVNAMLLNEFIKQHREVRQQRETIGELKRQVGELNTQLANLNALMQKVATRLEPQPDAAFETAANLNSARR